MTSTNILDGIAVARRSESEAATIMQAYIATGPQMAYTHAPQQPAPAPQRAATPQGPGTPGGGGQQRAAGTDQPQQAATSPAEGGVSPVVGEYEVFRNGRNALAFFSYRHPVLDENAEEGPFWFSIQNQRIVAGTSDAYAVFDDVAQDVLSAAKQRGVIMLVEFENQQPYRCTPCYLSDRF